VITLEKETFILEENGKDIECEVLFRFYEEEFQKNYLVYTDNTRDENGEVNIYISSYNPAANTAELEDIKDDKELEILSDIIEEMWDEECKNQ